MLLVLPNTSDLGIGKDDADQIIVLDGFSGDTGSMAGSSLALQDGDVYNLMGAGDISTGVYFRIAGLLKVIAGNMSAGAYFYSGSFKIKSGSSRGASESI